MTTIDINQITADKLANGDYRDTLPEYYQLNGVIEHSIWHDHQDAFDHMVKVYRSLEKELTFADLPNNLADRIRQYLQIKVGSHTREELLKVATLLHDIAKRETLINNADGTANCPGHEHLAFGQVKHFAARFGLDTLDQERVERLVLHHGFISDILFQTINKPEQSEQIWSGFIGAVGDVAYDLVIFYRSELHGCDLDRLAPAEYEPREKTLLGWLHTKLL